MDLKYQQIGPITSTQWTKLCNFFIESKKYEIADESVTGKINHITKRGTGIIVGYLGREDFYKVNSNDSSLKEDHAFLEKAYRILENSQRV